METLRKMEWLRNALGRALGRRRPAQRCQPAQRCRPAQRCSIRLLAVLGCGLLSWATVAPAAAEPAAERLPLLFWGVTKGCTRSRSAEQALVAHLARMGETLVDCPALKQALPEPVPCSGTACEAQVPPECKKSPQRLLGAELHTADRVTQLRIWLSEPRPDTATPRLRTVEDACIDCDDKGVAELLRHRAGELVEGRPATGGTCGQQATAETADSGALAAPPVTLLVVDLADRERSVRAAVAPYLTRLGHQVVLPRRRHAKGCVSQECLSTLAENFKEQGVTQILTIASGPAPETSQLFVYDTESHRAEQRNVECEGCDGPQLVTALVDAVGELAVRCLREHCPPPPRAEAAVRPEAACVPLPPPQCGRPKQIPQSPGQPPMPPLGRRIGAGVLMGTGVAVIAGSLFWSLASRTALSRSLSASDSCDFMSRGALAGSCQISNYGGVDIAGYFVGAAGIAGGVLLLKLPLERSAWNAAPADRK